MLVCLRRSAITPTKMLAGGSYAKVWCFFLYNQQVMLEFEAEKHMWKWEVTQSQLLWLCRCTYI